MFNSENEIRRPANLMPGLTDPDTDMAVVRHGASKFSRNALVRLGSLANVDALFSDRPAPAPMRSFQPIASSQGLKLMAVSSEREL